MDIHDRFEALNSEFLKFDRVTEKLSQRRDLHAFIRLDQWFPGETSDIVCAAWHDEICLDFDDEKLSTLTDEQLTELIRCGVRHCERNGAAVMFA